MEDLIREDPGAFFLFYYSGHGKVSDAGKLYLATRNTLERRLHTTGLAFNSILELKEAYGCSRFGIVLDCCYSGLAASDVRGSTEDQLKALAGGRGVFFLGAAAATQVAREEAILGHGVLTAGIIEGLQSGRADIDGDGRISGPDLFTYCKRFVSAHAKQEPICVNRVAGDELVFAYVREQIEAKRLLDVREKLSLCRMHRLLSQDELARLESFFNSAQVMLPEEDTLEQGFMRFTAREISLDDLKWYRKAARSQYTGTKLSESLTAGLGFGLTVRFLRPLRGVMRQLKNLQLLPSNIVIILILILIGLIAISSYTALKVNPSEDVIVNIGSLTAAYEQTLRFADALHAADIFKECEACPQMILVPAGEFNMGSLNTEEGHEISEEPRHPVKIALPFAVGRFAVTFDEWKVCVDDDACANYIPRDQGFGQGTHPVINVSWDDAERYVDWLKHKTGKNYRLLSEAEREYVTRAGTIDLPFWFGSTISPQQANYNSNFTYGKGVKGKWLKGTMPVKSFSPNFWGVYQVHGNVYEIVEDCWHGNYVGAPRDGSPWREGDCDNRVIRGGSWLNDPKYLRAGHRGDTTSTDKNAVGFRVARSLSR